MRRYIAVFTAVVAMANSAFAQDQISKPAIEQEAPATADADPLAPPDTRGLFLLALIPVMATVVERVGTSLVDLMFAPPKAPAATASAPPDVAKSGPVEANAAPSSESKPATGLNLPPQIPPLTTEKRLSVSVDQLASGGNYYAGIAYAVFVITPGGEARRVDAASYQFHTGDRFFVRYVPNMPGRIDVTNINPQGSDVLLGSWPVAAGEPVTLPAGGTFQFSGTSGDEILRLAFTPCTNGKPGTDISTNAVAMVNYGALLPPCTRRPAATRDITVHIENGVGYAVSQLDKTDLAAGAAESKAVNIRFQHAARTTLASRQWMISPEEANQPVTRQLMPLKSDPNGPRVIVRNPGEVKEVQAPVTINVEFEPEDGTVIDYDSLKITYLKMFNIDITDRLKPYLTSTGIHATNAKLASGDHTIEIAVKDTAGRRTVERFSFKVLPE